MPNDDPILQVVEDLAERIQRSVAVDDAELNYIAHSTHRFGDEDHIRLRSITERHLFTPVRDYVLSMDLETANDPLLVPATHTHGFENDRLLVPIRSQHSLVGVMWIIYSESFSPSDEKACRDASEQLASLLEPTAQESRGALIDKHLHELVSTNSRRREASVATLNDLGLFNLSQRVVAFVIARRDSAELEPDEIVEIQHAWIRTTRRFPSRPFSVSENARCFGILELPGTTDRAALLTVCENLTQQVATSLPAAHNLLIWGMGTAQEIENAHLSYSQAASAIAIGIRLELPHVLWEDYPLEALLDEAISPTIPAHRLPRLLRQTLNHIDTEVLSTVEAYLDQAGSASKVAQHQHLHRATVYYRIQQFERRTGLDFRSGADRLLIHLWLRLRGRIEE